VNWLPGGKTGVSVESFTEIRPTKFHFKAFLRLSDKQDRLFFFGPTCFYPRHLTLVCWLPPLTAALNSA
jgi:hypothetical protein